MIVSANVFFTNVILGRMGTFFAGRTVDTAASHFKELFVQESSGNTMEDQED